MRFGNFFAALAMLGVAGAGRAQIRLPLTLPATPLSSVSQNLSAAAPRTLDAVSAWRHQQIDRLVRNNRRVVETDPDGEPIVRGEIIAVGMSDESVAQARALGFAVDRESTAAGIRLIVLRVPEKLATREALRDLRAADPQAVYGYNHIYLGVAATDAPMPAGPPTRADGGATAARSRVGLLDSGVDATHPAFRDARIHAWGCGGRQVPAAHGTAVASLLVAHGGGELYAADVYCGLPTGGSVDAIVAALGWMAEQAVAVINVSLVGPKNALLERVVGALIARGHLIVAAVGNDGPAAPPLYPAAYPDVVGVTAVDAHRHVLIEAERGAQVMFAARGADLEAANLAHAYAEVRGTSFAAPTVAALLAAVASEPDSLRASAAIDALAKTAIHMGAAGRDLTYGFGLVGER